MPARFKQIALTALLLLSVVFRASSPSLKSLVILDVPPVEPYRQLINAIAYVETVNDTLAYNPIEQAAGIFQIRPIRLAEYNRLTGEKYKMKDLFNYEVSEKIFLFFADRIGPYNTEMIARKWNGSGHRTTFYWNRIKKYL
jgi:hypothetical protein